MCIAAKAEMTFPMAVTAEEGNPFHEGAGKAQVSAPGTWAACCGAEESQRKQQGSENGRWGTAESRNSSELRWQHTQAETQLQSSATSGLCGLWIAFQCLFIRVDCLHSF